MDSNEGLIQVEIRNNEEQIDGLLAELAGMLGESVMALLSPLSSTEIIVDNSVRGPPVFEVQIWFSEAHPDRNRLEEIISASKIPELLNNGSNPVILTIAFSMFVTST